MKLYIVVDMERKQEQEVQNIKQITSIKMTHFLHQKCEVRMRSYDYFHDKVIADVIVNERTKYQYTSGKVNVGVAIRGRFIQAVLMTNGGPTGPVGSGRPAEEMEPHVNVNSKNSVSRIGRRCKCRRGEPVNRGRGDVH